MSLSYRKARTASASSLRSTAYRTNGSARGTAYRVAGTGRATQPVVAGTGGTSQPDTAGAGRGAQPRTVGTSAMQPETVFGGPNEEIVDAAVTTDRMRHDNVVELFPGASSSASAPGRGSWWGRLRYAEAGMATAEYAIATLAAVGFAGLLVVILRSDEVRGFLMTIIQQALTLG